MNAWVGIDVAKESLEVVLLREQDEQQTSIPNTAQGFRTLHHFLKKRCRKGAAVCLEATGLYGDGVAEFLYQQGYRVSVVNPARIKAYGESLLRRNKTDRSDARLIAQFCRTQQTEAWTPLPSEVKELRAMLRHLDDLQGMCQQEQNRLQAGETSATVRAQLEQHILFLQQQMAHLQQQIEDHFDQHPDLKQQRDLLTSIPGIGDLTAGRLLAEVHDIRAFDSARQLAAYVGVTPRQHQSGTSVRRASHISKQGHRGLRAALYFPALTAKRHNPLVQPLVKRLRERGHSERSILLAAMHKLLHLVYGVLKSGIPFDPDYLAKKAALA